jgi:hypothetical protein
MTIVIPDDKREAVVNAVRRLVKAQVELWDASREIENALGIEVNSRSEAFESLAVATDLPSDADRINEAAAIKAIEVSVD